MSVRLKLGRDGTIEAVEADTVEELMAYHHQYASRDGNSAKKTARAQRSSAEDEDERLPEAAEKLVKVLLSATDGMNTTDVARTFGVKPRGVGGSVNSLIAWGKKRNLKRGQLLIKGRRANGDGHMARTIALAGFFRKMIREGKVPGMKLDT
jgi:hypothetical protein